MNQVMTSSCIIQIPKLKRFPLFSKLSYPCQLKKASSTEFKTSKNECIFIEKGIPSLSYKKMLVFEELETNPDYCEIQYTSSKDEKLEEEIRLCDSTTIRPPTRCENPISSDPVFIILDKNS